MGQVVRSVLLAFTVVLGVLAGPSVLTSGPSEVVDPAVSSSDMTPPSVVWSDANAPAVDRARASDRVEVRTRHTVLGVVSPAPAATTSAVTSSVVLAARVGAASASRCDGSRAPPRATALLSV